MENRNAYFSAWKDVGVEHAVDELYHWRFHGVAVREVDFQLEVAALVDGVGRTEHTDFPFGPVRFVGFLDYAAFDWVFFDLVEFFANAV